MKFSTLGILIIEVYELLFTAIWQNNSTLCQTNWFVSLKKISILYFFSYRDNSHTLCPVSRGIYNLQETDTKKYINFDTYRHS